MLRSFKLFSFFLLAAANLLLLGCGEGPIAPDDPRNFPVFVVVGKVIDSDGNPLTTGGEVRFLPDANSKYVSKGELGPDGSFRLTTELHGRGKVDGAPTGEYRVTVLPARPIYRHGSVTAGKKFTVTTGENNFTVEIRSAKDETPQRKE